MSGLRLPALTLLGLACCSGRPAQTPNATAASRPSPPTTAAPVVIGGKIARGKLDEGRRLLLAGDFAAARAAFDIATRDANTKVSALVGLAETELQLGHFAAAEAIAAKAAAAGGGGRVHVVLGNIRFKLRDYRRAAQSYEAALATDPDCAEARRNLATARRMADIPRR